MAKKQSDSLMDAFDKTAKKIGLINQPKSLFDGDKLLKEFEANGTKYYIMPPEKVFNIDRQVAYYNIEMAFAMCQTPTSIKLRFNEVYHTIIRLLQATGDDWVKLMDKLLKDCINNNESFKGELTSRYPAAYYICSLFIIKEGEDLGLWDFELANEKIDDWCKENYRAVDFFALALNVSKESQEIIEIN